MLYSFSGADGGGPVAGLIFDTAGNLYGTTEEGGAHGAGIVFELTPNGDGSWTESVLHSFNGTDGSSPFAGVIFDQAGNLYGTTGFGGASATGTVFKLTPNSNGSWTESVLHSFKGKDGLQPVAGVIFDQAGDLYGTTPEGGAYDYGVVFKLAPNSNGGWNETLLHTFTGGKDGGVLVAGVIFDQAGNLYGTTRNEDRSLCGGQGCGVVFKLTPNSNGGWKSADLCTHLPG